MLRSFQLLKQRRDVVVTLSGAQTHRARSDLEGARGFRLPCMCQSETEKPVHNYLERLTRAADLLFQEDSNIVVNGKSRSHIMMLQ